MTLLALTDVTLVRGGRMLFEHLTLEVQAGEGLHVSGPNGSGKSSLLRLVAGLLRPSAGSLRCDRLAMADEHLALDRELPLGKALQFWGGRHLEAALDAFAIGHLAGVPVRYLSTGQRKRVTLARVLASGVPLWLLDEPLNGLDEAGVACLQRVLQKHRAAGGIAVAASHQALPGTWRALELGE